MFTCGRFGLFRVDLDNNHLMRRTTRFAHLPWYGLTRRDCDEVDPAPAAQWTVTRRELVLQLP